MSADASKPRVHIAGCGVSASLSALLAVRQGCCVSFDPGEAAHERIVVVPRSTVELVEELTGLSIEDSIVSRWVNNRRIAWEQRAFQEVPAQSLILDAGALARAIAQLVLDEPPPANAIKVEDAADWTLIAERSYSFADRETAGKRRAVIGWVEELPNFDGASTVVASVPQGWLFASPHPVSGIALVVVSPSVCDGTNSSEVLQDALEFLWPGCRTDLWCSTGPSVLAAPSFAPSCASHGWMAIGEAAVFFDPLRGDGVGNAIRGALLAHAVQVAIKGGQEPEDCLSHYRERLAGVFNSHLQSSALHYSRAWNAPIWHQEIEGMRECALRLAAHSTPRFRLVGHRLVAMRSEL
jgi:hypothetical protein